MGGGAFDRALKGGGGVHGGRYVGNLREALESSSGDFHQGTLGYIP